MGPDILTDEYEFFRQVGKGHSRQREWHVLRPDDEKKKGILRSLEPRSLGDTVRTPLMVSYPHQ